MRKICTNDCVSEFQDKAYGKGVRVHNEDKKGVPHCTVCGGDHQKQKYASYARNWNPAYSLAPKNDGIKKAILPPGQ
jgi:putative component of toxin-antitoxin plasmid stabilization module